MNIAATSAWPAWRQRNVAPYAFPVNPLPNENESLPTPRLRQRNSEINLQGQLDSARIVRTRDLAKVAGTIVRADSIVKGVAYELRVVPHVKEFRTELQAAPA